MKTHTSNVKDIREIQGYACVKEKCVCNSGAKLHCPLCDVNRLSPLAPNKLSSHISAVHWNHKLQYKDVFILCCNLDCDPGNHFHCPVCSSVHSRLSRIRQHLEVCETKDVLGAKLPSGLGLPEILPRTEVPTESIMTAVSPSVSIRSINETVAPSDRFVKIPDETNIMHSSEIAMDQNDALVQSIETSIADDAGTVYIIQEEDLDSSVIEALKQSQIGNADFSKNAENTEEQSNFMIRLEGTNSGDGSENVVMFINESDLDSAAMEKLRSGKYVLQSGDNLDQVVLLEIPENDNQHSAIEDDDPESMDIDPEESDHIASLQKQLGQFYHESFIRGWMDLTSLVNDKEFCVCPLCDDEEEGPLQFDSFDQVLGHLEKLHWSMRIDLVGFSIVSCGLPCALDQPSNSNDFHWHCPYCWITGEFAAMRSHVRSHTEITNVCVSEEPSNVHRKAVKLKQTNDTQKPGPPRRRGRPTNSEKTLKFIQELLDDVIDAAMTGNKSWETEKEECDDEANYATNMDTEDMQTEPVQPPPVFPRFGDDGRELVIRTRRQQGIESGVSLAKYKRKFIEIDSDDEITVGADNDEDYNVPEIVEQQKTEAEERSLEMLLLAAEKTAPSNAEDMQIAVSEDGTLLLQSVRESSLGNMGSNSSKRRFGSIENIVCPSCRRPFRKRQMLYQHLFNSKCLKNESLPSDILDTIHDAIKNVNSRTCPLCDKDFCDMQHARVHYSLRTCQNTFVGKMGYEKNETTGQYKCHHCDFSSMNPRVLVAHEAREHVDKKDYECTICHRKYAFHVLLQRHLKTTHFAPSLPKCQCEICGKTMYTKHIKQHMRLAHDPNYVRTKEPELDYQIQCDQCNFRTTFRRKFEIHKQRIHGDNDKQCNKCGRTFSLQRDLTAHVKTCLVDIEERQEECSHCGKKMLKRNLKSHIDLVHRNNRRYECQVCNKKFQTKYVLQCHMDTHRHPSERIPKFLCGTCGKGFTNKTMLKDHINMHTGNTPYACKYCEKQFKCGPTLHRHQELHTGIRYNCRICGSMFTTKSYWKQHMKKHTDDTTLKCECGKEYQTNTGLKNHRITCSAVVDTELAVKQLETQTIDGTTFLWSEEDQQVLQVSSQEMDGETLVVLETIDGEGNDIMSTPVAGDDGEVVTIVQSDDQVVMETVLAEEMIEQQVALESTEVDTEGGQEHFLCGHCQQTFTTMEEVQDHMLNHFEELAVGEEVNLAIQTASE